MQPSQKTHDTSLLTSTPWGNPEPSSRLNPIYNLTPQKITLTYTQAWDREKFAFLVVKHFFKTRGIDCQNNERTIKKLQDFFKGSESHYKNILDVGSNTEVSNYHLNKKWKIIVEESLSENSNLLKEVLEVFRVTKMCEIELDGYEAPNNLPEPPSKRQKIEKLAPQTPIQKPMFLPRPVPQSVDSIEVCDFSDLDMFKEFIEPQASAVEMTQIPTNLVQPAAEPETDSLPEETEDISWQSFLSDLETFPFDNGFESQITEGAQKSLEADKNNELSSSESPQERNLASSIPDLGFEEFAQTETVAAPILQPKLTIQKDDKLARHIEPSETVTTAAPILQPKLTIQKDDKLAFIELSFLVIKFLRGKFKAQFPNLSDDEVVHEIACTIHKRASTIRNIERKMSIRVREYHFNKYWEEFLLNKLSNVDVLKAMKTHLKTKPGGCELVKDEQK